MSTSAYSFKVKLSPSAALQALLAGLSKLDLVIKRVDPDLGRVEARESFLSLQVLVEREYTFDIISTGASGSLVSCLGSSSLGGPGPSQGVLDKCRSLESLLRIVSTETELGELKARASLRDSPRYVRCRCGGDCEFLSVSCEHCGFDLVARASELPEVGG